MKKQGGGKRMPSVLSEKSVRPKKQKSPGKQKAPPSVDSILRKRDY